VSADLGSNASAMLGAAVRHDHPVVQTQAHTPAPTTTPMRSSDGPVFFGIVLMLCVGVLKIALRRRLSSRHAVSLDLVMVSIGFVLLLMMRLPIGRGSGWIGAALFLSLPVFYRLLGHFEEPDDKA
jgi:hypothetical protein